MHFEPYMIQFLQDGENLRLTAFLAGPLANIYTS